MFTSELSVICPNCAKINESVCFIEQDLAFDTRLDMTNVYSELILARTIRCDICNCCFDIDTTSTDNNEKLPFQDIINTGEYQSILNNEKYNELIKHYLCIALIHDRSDRNENFIAGKFYLYSAMVFEANMDNLSVSIYRKKSIQKFLLVKLFNETIPEDWINSFRIELSIIDSLRRTKSFLFANQFLDTFLSNISKQFLKPPNVVMQILSFQSFLLSIKSTLEHFLSETIRNRVELVCTECTIAKNSKGYIIRLDQIIETHIYKTFYTKVDGPCKIGTTGELDLNEFMIIKKEFKATDNSNSIKESKANMNWLTIKLIEDSDLSKKETITTSDEEASSFNLNDFDRDDSNWYREESEMPSAYGKNPWIDVFGHGSEADDAYWNTD